MNPKTVSVTAHAFMAHDFFALHASEGKPGAANGQEISAFNEYVNSFGFDYTTIDMEREGVFGRCEVTGIRGRLYTYKLVKK